MNVNFGSAINIASTSDPYTFADDVKLSFGTGSTAGIQWQTDDANANCLAIILPAGGATDVPVIVIGDTSVEKDLTLFNGVTVPTVAVFDASEAHYLKIDGSGTIASDTTITFSPSGHAATLTMTSDGTVTSLIPATGDYLRIGDAGTTSHSLAGNDDLYVSGKFEAKGNWYLDDSGTIASGKTLSIINGYVAGSNTDNAWVVCQARDTGVGLVELARLAGADDPYFQIGRDDTGVATNAVTVQGKIQGGAGTNNEAAGFGVRFDWLLGNAASEVESRACIDAVLATATNGSEDVNFVFSLMDGGVAPAAVLTLTGADKSATFAGVVKSGANVGTANTGVTAVEYGDGSTHRTVLTVSRVDALTLADNASLGVGYKLYDLPAGAVIVERAYMSMAITAAAAEQKTDTPDVGLGTVVASGAVATLGGTATFENILTGQTANDCNGTAEVKTITNQELVIEAADAHTVYFNVADGWADIAGADLTADIAGTVVLVWRFMA